MIIFLVIAAALALLLAVLLGLRLLALQKQTNDLSVRTERQERAVAELTERVWRLESGHAATPGQPAERKPAEETRAPAAVTVTTAPRREDWEALVGANWLNRLGALVLVIGIALFLGYSLTQLGPAGKIVIGFGAGGSLLMAGIALERSPMYRDYSYSLMGAGWAVAYFTAYAAHGVPAARVIHDPGAGLILLILVSAGMVFHALRYRSEIATALAYLLAFMGLNVSPLSPFSVAATLLLALSLVALAYRFDWLRLPLLGIVLTYLTFVLRYDASIYAQAGLLNGQVTLWVYWIAFEVFDLLDVRRRPARRRIEHTLFLLNACGFTGASLLHHWNVRAGDWSVFFAVASVAYLTSACLRSRWTRQESEATSSGGHEVAAAVSAALMAGALVERFSGLGITLALLFEGELVLLAGMALGSKWIWRSGAVLLIFPLFRLLAVDAMREGEMRALGLEIERWTPAAILMAAVFVLNRRLLPYAWYFAAGAATLAVAVIMAEAPRLWVAPAVSAGALVLLFTAKHDLVWIATPALLVGWGRAAIVNTDSGDVLTTGVVAACLYAGQILWRDTIAWVRPGLSVFASALLALLIYEKVEGRLLTVGLGLEGAALLAAGFLVQERVLRLSGLALFLLCIGKLFLYDLRELDTVSRILSFIVLGLVLMGASWLYTRYRDKVRRLL